MQKLQIFTLEFELPDFTAAVSCSSSYHSTVSFKFNNDTNRIIQFRPVLQALDFDVASGFE
jgi:hypothetical protein